MNTKYLLFINMQMFSMLFSHFQILFWKTHKILSEMEIMNDDFRK